MRSKLTIVAVCIMAMALLAGCKRSGSDSLSFFGSSGTDNLVGGDLSAGGGSNPASGGTGGGAGGDITSGTHMPEPATLALIGGGLLAYALLRRKRKR